MRQEYTYTFKVATACNMCGAPADDARVMGRRLNRSHGKNPSRLKGISTTIVRCNRCDLIYCDPLPIPASIQDHYGVPAESYWKEEYFNEDPGYFAQQLGILKKLQPMQEGMRALDIGAGLGKAMKAMQRAGYDTFGFEPSASFHKMALQRMGIDAGKLKNGMIESVNYEPATFDFITFGAVLEHLYDPSDSITRALSWLKPGGIIHIEVPSSKWLIGKFINIFYKLRPGDYVGNLSPMHEPFHLYEFSLDSFRKNAKRQNYEIAYHHYYECQTFLPPLLDPLIHPFMRATDTGMQLSIWLRKK